MKPTSPCLNCEIRHPGCHSECEKYIGFQKDLDEYKEKLNSQKAEINADNFLLRRYKRGTR